MLKLKNVTGVPISFDGVSDTVRFLKGQSKTFEDNEVTPSLREGINNGSLVSKQIEEPAQETTRKKSSKKNKEVEE